MCGLATKYVIIYHMAQSIVKSVRACHTDILSSRCQLLLL